MINITYLRLFRFVVFVNVVYMLNIVQYSKRGSYIIIILYSMISLLIGYVLHESFTNDIIPAIFNDNLLIR